MVKNLTLSFLAWAILHPMIAMAETTCATGVAAKPGDDYVSARFCKGEESIIIHYRAEEICSLEFAGGTLLHRAFAADASGKIKGEWNHTLPGVYVCS